MNQTEWICFVETVWIYAYLYQLLKLTVWLHMTVYFCPSSKKLCITGRTHVWLTLGGSMRFHTADTLRNALKNISSPRDLTIQNCTKHMQWTYMHDMSSNRVSYYVYHELKYYAHNFFKLIIQRHAAYINKHQLQNFCTESDFANIVLKMTKAWNNRSTINVRVAFKTAQVRTLVTIQYNAYLPELVHKYINCKMFSKYNSIHTQFIYILILDYVLKQSTRYFML